MHWVTGTHALMKRRSSARTNTHGNSEAASGQNDGAVRRFAVEPSDDDSSMTEHKRTSESVPPGSTIIVLSRPVWLSTLRITNRDFGQIVSPRRQNGIGCISSSYARNAGCLAPQAFNQGHACCRSMLIHGAFVLRTQNRSITTVYWRSHFGRCSPRRV